MNAKLCAAWVSLFACAASSAFAADLPSRKAPPVLPPPPVLTWTGFYAGLNAGGTWSNNNTATFGAVGLVDDPIWLPGGPFALSATGVATGNSGAGFIGGGQIGYNYQFGSSFLVGFETDIQGVAGTSGTAQAVGVAVNTVTFDPVSTPTTVTRVNRRMDYFGTVRGRLGWLVTPTLLVYGTGGFAYGGFSLSAAQYSFDPSGLYGTGFGATSFNRTATGWTAGGGVEWMFWPNWSAKVEYLYYDLGHASSTLSPVSGLDQTVFAAPGTLGFMNVTRVSTRLSGNIVRAGVNYHFNWGAPAPVLAKY
ncbi:MAG: outer membrane protein [Methylocystis sp.]|uniref:outer membrane protein n=1 Tax=Methylocystis sp. TaxID=1911079 RepID=UPI003DA23739